MESLTRARLSGLRRRRLHGGRNLTKGIIDLVDMEGRSLVVKDFSVRPWLVRRFLGPWQLDREARAYDRLLGLAGIPRLLGRLDRQAIALEFVPGRTLAEIRPGEIGEPFFDALESLLEAMHARGVAHGDLHHRDVLAGADGRPHVVDFSTSITAGPGAGPLQRFLFREMRRADLHAATRLRRRLVPGTRRRVSRRPVLYLLGAALKRIRNLLRGKPARS